MIWRGGWRERLRHWLASKTCSKLSVGVGLECGVCSRPNSPAGLAARLALSASPNIRTKETRHQAASRRDLRCSCLFGVRLSGRPSSQAPCRCERVSRAACVTRRDAHRLVASSPPKARLRGGLVPWELSNERPVADRRAGEKYSVKG